MPDALEQPLEEFHRDLNRLEHLLKFVVRLREFGGIELAATIAEDPFSEQSTILREQIRGLSSDFPIFSGTLLLYMAGRFEHFVRTSFENLCDSFAAKCRSFDQLPKAMRSTLTSSTAEILLRPNKHGYDEVGVRGVVKQLSSNLDAKEGLGVINSSLMSFTDSNMNPGTLQDLYKRVGISTIWSDVSKQAILKVHFGYDKDQDAEREARTELENLMRERNGIAHPTSSSSFPDPTRVQNYLAYLRILSQVLTDVSRVHLAAYRIVDDPVKP
jgi:hypothetical protein